MSQFIRSALLNAGVGVGGAVGATLGAFAIGYLYDEVYELINGKPPQAHTPDIKEMYHRNGGGGGNNGGGRNFQVEHRRDRDRNFHHTGGQYSRHDAQRYNNDRRDNNQQRRDYPDYSGRPYTEAAG